MKRGASLLGVGLLAGTLHAADTPPREKGPFRQPDLVELVVLDPTIHLDIRYATPQNLVGRPVYTQARAFLQRPAAQALVRVHRALAEKGYGLLVFDGYRPWSVTKLFWDLVPREKHAFVADPSEGSKHNRGCAVDLTLYDLATGREVEMPSAYDETTERASPRYSGGTSEQRARRDLLRRAMEREGFKVEPNEWWHFNYKDWRHYPLLDIPFERIEGRPPPRIDPGPPAGRTPEPTTPPPPLRIESPATAACGAISSSPPFPLPPRGEGIGVGGR